MPKARDLAALPAPRAEAVLWNEVLPFWRNRFSRDPGVRFVEGGIRRRGGALDEERTLVLKAFVAFKGRPAHGEHLPAAVHRSTTAEGRLRIEVDVEDVPAIEPQFRHTTAPTLEASYSGSTGFCVEAENGGKYVVSAAHVLWGDPFDSSSTWTKGGRGGEGVTLADPCWRWCRDPDTGTFQVIDAGIVEVAELDDLGPLADAELTPRADSLSSFRGRWRNRSVRICGRNGVVRAEYDAHMPPGLGVAVHGRSIPYVRLLRFAAEGSGTSPGDSGAPVIDEDGRLVGIHVAEKATSTSSWSYVVHVEDIFRAFRTELGETPRLLS